VAAGRLSGRTALITGASRGIGAAVAKRYAAEGAHVILAARTRGGLEEVDDAIRAETGKRATLVTLDLRNLDSIDALCASIYQRFDGLDILLGNAAMLGTLSPVAHVAPDVWEEVFTVNVTANHRLLRAADALLRQSDAGRALFVTSGVTQGVFAYWSAYAASKAALEQLVMVYAAEVSKTGVRANLVDPGIVATALRAQAFPGEDPGKLKRPEEITELFMELAEPGCSVNGQRLRV